MRIEPGGAATGPGVGDIVRGWDIGTVQRHTRILPGAPQPGDSAHSRPRSTGSVTHVMLR
jgi:hypothetical protein